MNVISVMSSSRQAEFPLIFWSSINQTKRYRNKGGEIEKQGEERVRRKQKKRTKEKEQTTTITTTGKKIDKEEEMLLFLIKIKKIKHLRKGQTEKITI